MCWQRLAARGGADRRIRTGGVVTTKINTAVIEGVGGLRIGDKNNAAQ